MKYALAIVLLVAMVGCQTTLCPGLTGIALTSCEVQGVVSVIETVVPPTLAQIDAVKGNLAPNVVAQINSAEAKWPALKASMDALVAGLIAGQQVNIPVVIADAVLFYVDLGILYQSITGKVLPGLPPEPAVQAFVSNARAARLHR